MALKLILSKRVGRPAVTRGAPKDSIDEGETFCTGRVDAYDTLMRHSLEEVGTGFDAEMAQE
jgi:hypothetical protein